MHTNTHTYTHMHACTHIYHREMILISSLTASLIVTFYNSALKQEPCPGLLFSVYSILILYLPLYYNGSSEAFKQEEHEWPLCLHVTHFFCSPHLAMFMSILSACVSVHYRCSRCPEGPAKGIRSPGTRVTDSCETLCEYWESNLGPLTEPFLQPQHLYFQYYNIPNK